MLKNTENACTPLSEADTVGKLVEGKLHLRLYAETPVDTIITVMAHHNKRIACVIGRDGVLQGVVTRSALYGRLALGSGFDVGRRIDITAAHALCAGDVMIANPLFLASELSVSDALAIMSTHGFRAMPVLRDGGVLVGMAEMRDLANAEQSRYRDTIESQDSLLSYFMHHEDYGRGSTARIR